MTACTEHERAFNLFGSRVLLLIGAPLGAERRPADLAALEVEAMLRGLHSELTRFESGSALSLLNADANEQIETTPSVALLVEAARVAALESGGLVDASVVEVLERTGYARSRTGLEPADLREALRAAPLRKAAAATNLGLWRRVSVELAKATVRRPSGMRIDSGGSGKGLAADLAARHLTGFSSFAIDCGGDIRIGGLAGFDREVDILHPYEPASVLRLALADGGVATSGLRTRIWKDGERYSHHLIDPGSGKPAWTGIVQATALAPTAVSAETLAKFAFLSGPEGARRVLDEHGGLFVHDSGEVEAVGPIVLIQPLVSESAA